MTAAASAVVLGALLIVSGAAFDSPSLYVPGVGLTLLGSVAPGWVLLAARARLERELGPTRIEEEEPYVLRLRIRAPVPLPPGSELVEPLLGEPLPVSGRERDRRARVQVRFSRRGRRRIEPARLVVRDPLGLAVREVRSTAGELLVLPRIERVLVAPAGGEGESGGVGGRRGRESAEVELDSLRPYRAGAPASRIHWPTVARTGEMIERRLVADADLRPLVVLDARAPESEDALDRAVRAAASLCVFLARRGGCHVLLPGDRRPAEIDRALRAWPALHARLALVEAGGGPPASAWRERAGAVFWVTADPAATPGRGLPRALMPVTGERFLVLAAGRAQRGGAFEVAGCRGHVVGQRARAVA